MSRFLRSSPALIVFAKAPVAGRSKTRLCPPCSPEEAAAIAEGSLADTLRTAVASTAGRAVCVLAGEPGPWLPRGVEVVPQRAGGFDERIAGAFADVGRGPALLIGMDVPQAGLRRLDAALAALSARGTDAVVGHAEDGGWWALGLRRPDPAAALGVPSSTDDAGAAQAARLDALGLRTTLVATLRDVDTFDDALAVADLCPPGAAFPRAVAAVGEGHRAPAPQ